VPFVFEPKSSEAIMWVGRKGKLSKFFVRKRKERKGFPYGKKERMICGL
jgi:hypothetical protein